MNIKGIIEVARTLAGEHPGQTERAWAIAWRAVRFLEQAAETARRSRLAEFTPRGPSATLPDYKVVAAQCVSLAVRGPVFGEPAVVAALENAADAARSVSEALYRERVAAHAKVSSAVLDDPRRKAKLMRGRTLTETRGEAFAAANAAEGDK